MSDFEVPEDLRYTSDHEWVRPLGDGVLRIGITAYAQDALGDVVFVQVPEVGQTVAAGEACGEIESTKSVSDLIAPVAGSVTAVNEALENTPDLLNSDPYGQGWLIEVTAQDEGGLGDLMDAEAYRGSLD